MIQPGKPIRIALAIFLIVTLAMCLTGCIIIPLWGYAKNDAGVAPSKELGPADSHKPLRVTFATRKQVIALFGNPDLSSDDGRAIGYTNLSAPDWLFISICGGGQDRSNYSLFLEFDDNNVLRRYRLVGDYAWVDFLRETSHVTPATNPRP
jgi:hypothetical protein